MTETLPPTTEPRPAPRPDRAERTRQKILDAAGHCFAAAGYSKTTVEEIAARAGVSKGIVYHHFSGKEGLLERAIEQLVADWIEVSGLEVWVRRTDSLEDAIAGMLRGSLEYARSHPFVKALFQFDPVVLRAFGTSEGIKRLSTEARARMVAAMQAGIARGELRSDLDAERLTDLLRMLDMALIDHLLAPDWIDVSDDRFIDTCVDVLFRGMGAPR